MPNLITVVLWVLLALPSTLFAQTVLSVPLQTGVLAWDAPVASPTNSLPTHYRVTCGAAVTTFPAPATSIPIRDFIAGPGAYTCTLRAENSFGCSPDATVPAFTTGYVPDTPLTLRLEVR